LLVTGSKSGTVYLLDRDRLGHFQPNADSQIVQSLIGAVGPLFGIPSYFNNTVYFSPSRDQVKAFGIQNGSLSPAPISASSATFAMPGTVPSISAGGPANGILWTIDPAGQLHAYDAADLGVQLYQGSVGSSVKFSTPTIANGKVYVGTMNSLAVFGLKDQMTGSITAIVNAEGFQPGPVTPGSLITLFGSNLAQRAAQASITPWPEVLENTSVFINGVAVPLGYVSTTQINAQVPLRTAPGKATVTVVVDSRVLPPAELTVHGAAHIKGE
jgi:outer membrane protein assembly factor BamB